jgi:hypothetical protein
VFFEKNGLGPLGVNNNQSINIGVSFYYYPSFMPCEIKAEVAQDYFLRVVNTTFYATTMDFSKNSFFTIHNVHIHYKL